MGQSYPDTTMTAMLEAHITMWIKKYIQLPHNYVVLGQFEKINTVDITVGRDAL